MLRIVIHIIGFYLVLIGTWRLANAAAKAPIGGEMYLYKEQEENYNPLGDLFCPLEVFVWMFRTIASFSKPGRFTNAVILHKKFSWGLMWLLFGIFMQFIAGLVP